MAEPIPNWQPCPPIEAVYDEAITVHRRARVLSCARATINCVVSIVRGADPSLSAFMATCRATVATIDHDLAIDELRTQRARAGRLRRGVGVRVASLSDLPSRP